MAALGNSVFDLVVSNPPYVTPDDYPNLQPEVREFEPEEALVGGPGGVAVPARVLAEVTATLKPGAHVLLEHGMAQGDQLREAAEVRGASSVNYRAAADSIPLPRDQAFGFAVPPSVKLSHRIEASTDLIHWAPLGNAALYFKDYDSTNFTQRFYRFAE
jgi:hypothetical protein